MKETKQNWHDAKRKPTPFVSVLGLLSEADDFPYPRVREVFFVPKEEREEVLRPRPTDADFFEPKSGYWCPALHEFIKIVKWAAMPDPVLGDEPDE